MKNIKQISILFFCVVLVALVVGCKTPTTSLPPMESKEKKETVITETLRDTIFLTEKDSSFYRAYIDCVNGQPVLRDSEKTNGRKLNAPNVNLKGNKLNVDCQAEAEKLLAQWKETNKAEFHFREIKIPYEVIVEKELTQFQHVQMWLGRIFFFVAIIWVIARLIKKYLNKF